MELQAVTGQLYIVDGNHLEQDEVPGLLAQSAPSSAHRSRSRDHLFIHLSLSGPPSESETLAQDLIDTISANFYSSAGSVTSALRKALLEANQRLFGLNMSNGQANQEGAISIAAHRGNDLFMVQTGESLALIGRAYGAERLPVTPPDHVTPLGRTAGIDIRFFHNVIEAGDTLAFADPRLSHLNTQTLENSVVDVDVEMGLAEYKRLIGPGTGRILFVEFTDEPIDDLPESTAPRPRAEANTMPIPSLEPRRESAVNVDAPTVQTDRVRRNNIDIERSARRVTAQTARGISRASDGLADVMARIKPPSQTNTAEDPTASLVLPVILSLVIPIIVSVIVIGVYFQRNVVQQSASVESSMSQALLAAQTAESEARIDDARVNYNQILLLAADAETQLGPNSEYMLSMRQSARDALDRLDNISRLNSTVLYSFDDDSVLSKLAIRESEGTGDFYVLNSAHNAVFAFDTDATYTLLEPSDPNPQPILADGASVAGHIVNTMVDLLWLPSGPNNPSSLLGVLDTTGTLLTYNPIDTIRRQTLLELSSTWGKPIAMTTYNERLYILDSEGESLWRYFADGAGYGLQVGNQTIELRGTPNLTQATDFAINNEDARLAVTYADGDMRYFDTNSGLELWNSASVSQSGLITPITSASAVRIVGSGVGASIFVLDASTGRLLQISLGGTILTVYQSTDADGNELFKGVTDFYVLQNPLRVLVPAGDKIYLATQ